MMHEEKDLFRVQLDENGIHSIQRIYSIVRLCFWIGAVVNALMLFSQLYLYIKYIDVFKNSSSPYTTRLLVVMIYMILFVIAYFLQFFYFFKFSGKAKKAIHYNNSNLFNESFSLLYRAFWMTFAGLLLNGLYTVYEFISQASF